MDPAHLSFLHTIISGSQFTDEFGKLAELDYMETPIGMVYISSRRVGENVWVRVADYIPPNVHQFPPITTTGLEELAAVPPTAIVWAVPIDDTHTTGFAFRYVLESDDRPQMLGIERFANRTYEDMQRAPGDSEAQRSIHWGIARHGLEHLTTTDRGVIMLRNIVRKGIQSNQRGGNPLGVATEAREVIPTYSNDTVVRVPLAASAEADKELVRATGRKLAQSWISNHPGRAAPGAYQTGTLSWGR